jgi:mycofactocin system glycosyltransferase
MIPIVYRLRKSIRFQKSSNSFLVISESPLNIVRASQRAVRILELCDGNRTLQQIAWEMGNLSEEQVFEVCCYFNKRSALETVLTENADCYPSVTIIIPTRNRKESLVECLDSVFLQEYPRGKFDVIVVDDGSEDGTSDLAGSYPEDTYACRFFLNPKFRGQSYCRNLGAKHAKGEILAFLDSDCVAARFWLKTVVPCFRWKLVGAAGGFVDGYFDNSPLDRYEKVCSPLNMGKYMLLGANDRSLFYIPTCNMLVRKDAFADTGGLRESLYLGEDVDFCWRLRQTGWHVIYVPDGPVFHKHRNKLTKMLRRRAEYGASEAILCSLHPGKSKALQIRPLSFFAFLMCCLSIVLLTPLPLWIVGACFMTEGAAKALRLHRIRARISLNRTLFSVLRVYLSSFYFMAYHLIRYYLVIMLLVGFAAPSVWLLVIFFLTIASLVDYCTKHPKLAPLTFLILYALDNLTYQLGVIAGCLQAKSFRSYTARFVWSSTAE